MTTGGDRFTAPASSQSWLEQTIARRFTTTSQIRDWDMYQILREECDPADDPRIFVEALGHLLACSPYRAAVRVWHDRKFGVHPENEWNGVSIDAVDFFRNAVELRHGEKLIRVRSTPRYLPRVGPPWPEYGIESWEEIGSGPAAGSSLSPTGGPLYIVTDHLDIRPGSIIRVTHLPLEGTFSTNVFFLVAVRRAKGGDAFIT